MQAGVGEQVGRRGAGEGGGWAGNSARGRRCIAMRRRSRCGWSCLGRLEWVGQEYLDEVRTWVRAAIRLRERLCRRGVCRDCPPALWRVRRTLVGWSSRRQTNCRGLWPTEWRTGGGAIADAGNRAGRHARRVGSEMLAEQDWVRTMVERPDARVRELERLEACARGAAVCARGLRGGVADSLQRSMAWLPLRRGAGQKTGAFLKEAELCGRCSICAWRALDVCSYQGGFALHLARVC